MSKTLEEIIDEKYIEFERKYQEAQEQDDFYLLNSTYENGDVIDKGTKEIALRNIKERAYERALWDVNYKILDCDFWTKVDNTTLLRVGEILANLKAKGGV